MEKEKIGNNELKALGINDVEVLVNFSRVANGLLKHNVMAKPEILANLEALIDDPMPYALKKGGKFKNLAEDVIAMRKEGKFVKQERSNFKLKEEIADFPVWGLENIEVGALAQMRTASAIAHRRRRRFNARRAPGLWPAYRRRVGYHGQHYYPVCCWVWILPAGCV
jgi:tRNA-splicing ligase RtcB